MKKMMKKALRVLLKEKMTITKSTCQDPKKSYQDGEINKPPTTNNSFLGEEFSLPPNDDDTWTPLNYFQMFWKDDINVLLSEQTNPYSIQQKGTSLNTTSGKIEQFIGIQMYMPIIDFPAYQMLLGTRNKVSTNCRCHVPKQISAIARIFTC